MKEPVVSIIVPVYNLKKYLSRCIESILLQSYKNYECILVDDGSVDGSSEICDIYAKKDSRIKVIHKENGGVSNARNVGIEMSIGKYVCFIDGDDWVDKTLLDKAVLLIEKMHSQIIGWGMRVYDGYSFVSDYYSEQPVFLYKEEKIFPEWFNSPCTKMYLRSLIIDNKIRFPEGISLAEDLCFNYQCYSYVNEIPQIQETLYNYFSKRPDSAVQSISMEKIKQEIKSIGILSDFFKNEQRDIFISSLVEREKNAKTKFFYKALSYEDVKEFYGVFPEISIDVYGFKNKVKYFCIKIHFTLPFYIFYKLIRKR